MMRATRPLSAPWRSASSDTLLALGNAAASTSIDRPNAGTVKPAARAPRPMIPTSSGCTRSFVSATGRYSRSGVRVCACWPARHSTAPIVNSATGEAESASIFTTCAAAPGNCVAVAAASAPSAIAQGCGFVAAPRNERAITVGIGAPAAPSLRCPCACASARHSVLVRNRSTSSVPITGPAAASPNSATSNGTPMKPLFGNAATSAPKAAFFRSTPRLRAMTTVSATTSSAHSA